MVIQPRAESDIAEAYQYIEKRAPDASVRWYNGIKNAILSLANMPSRCSYAPESEKLQQDLRHLHCGKRTASYRIIFKIIEDLKEVHVLTIRRAARNSLEIGDLDLTAGG